MNGNQIFLLPPSRKRIIGFPQSLKCCTSSEAKVKKECLRLCRLAGGGGGAGEPEELETFLTSSGPSSYVSLLRPPKFHSRQGFSRRRQGTREAFVSSVLDGRSSHAPGLGLVYGQGGDGDSL